jgi:hypothetical protein
MRHISNLKSEVYCLPKKCGNLEDLFNRIQKQPRKMKY